MDGEPDRAALRFYVVVLLLTAPFYLLGWLSAAQLVPGVPLGGLAVVCPALAAVICTHRERGGPGVRVLLARSFDARRIARKAWYLPVLLLYPAVLAISYAVLRLRGVDVPAPQVGPTAVLLAVGFFVGALGEELGWSGYAVEALLRRRNALTAGLLVGAGWAVWHWVPLLQVGRSPVWIAWWTLGTVAARVIMVWLFVNTGHSVFAMALFHMVLNLGWQLFPVQGSYFDQPTVAVLMAAVAVLVTLGWRTRMVGARRGAAPAGGGAAGG
jgi:membrane protease YdiL (CAAX protease family)